MRFGNTRVLQSLPASLENGYTVQDGKGNQYVWVEVPKTEEVYPTAGLNITDFVEMLSQGVNGNIIVKGTTAYDLEINDEIVMTCEELAYKIAEPNGINIVF